MLHIPLTNLLLLATKQEPYKKKVYNFFKLTLMSVAVMGWGGGGEGEKERKPIILFLKLTLTGVAVILILPQEMASSGRAPESLPSNSDAVLTNTEKSAPFL